MPNAKPAAGSGGHRNILIADWKPHQKNTLRGFFTATMPSGLVIHDLMLHESNGKRWVGLPGRPWTDEKGTKQFVRIIEFSDRATADHFRDAVLSALDAYLEVQP
jgi:hypothetical protein